MNGMSKRLLLHIAVLLTYVALSVPSAYACECGGRGSPRKELGKSRAVFVGEVVEITDGEGGDPYLIKFRVGSYWKGAKDQFVTISSPGGLCGISFKVGQRWLVYAYGQDLWTDACHRTKPLASAGEDLHALGKPKR